MAVSLPTSVFFVGLVVALVAGVVVFQTLLEHLKFGSVVVGTIHSGTTFARVRDSPTQLLRVCVRAC